MHPWNRADGVRIPGLSPLRRFLPALMPRRNDAVVYFEQQLAVGPLLAWIDGQNAARPADAPQLKLFTLIIAALTRTLALRPRLNRFIAGGRTWQREGISVGYVVKKAMADDAGMTTVRVHLWAEATLDDVATAMEAMQRVGRGSALLTSEKEVAAITTLPPLWLRGLLRLQRLLDGLGLLPGAMLRDDPLYASVMCANLGSVGLDAPFHHLFEYGTTPIFLTIGRVHRAPWVDADDRVVAADVVKLCWSYDERIADGFYAARSLERFAALLVNPATLLTPPPAKGAPPRRLVTGFDAFPGVECNPTEAVVLALSARGVGPNNQADAADTSLTTAVLPVSWRRGPAALRRALEASAPEIALHLGVAAGTDRLRVERVAAAVARERPDADDALADGPPPAGQICFDAAEVVAALEAAGLPASVSDDAGGYLCNAIFGHSLRDAQRRGTIAAFMHVPPLATPMPGAIDGAVWTQEALERAVAVTLVALKSAAE